jgi:hypothetical protein
MTRLLTVDEVAETPRGDELMDQVQLTSTPDRDAGIRR